jgi:hypothetical protein
MKSISKSIKFYERHELSSQHSNFEIFRSFLLVYSHPRTTNKIMKPTYIFYFLWHYYFSPWRLCEVQKVKWKVVFLRRAAFVYILSRVTLEIIWYDIIYKKALYGLLKATSTFERFKAHALLRTSTSLCGIFLIDLFSKRTIKGT